MGALGGKPQASGRRAAFVFEILAGQSGEGVAPGG